MKKPGAPWKITGRLFTQTRPATLVLRAMRSGWSGPRTITTTSLGLASGS
jgi:hypothetical protein